MGPKVQPEPMSSGQSKTMTVNSRTTEGARKTEQMQKEDKTPTNGTKTARSSTFWFYSFIPFKVATGGLSPLAPILTIENGGTSVDVGIANAMGSIFSMLGGIIWGKLSDSLQKRKVFLMMGFVAVSMFAIIFALTKTPTEVIKVNAIYSLLIASTMPIPVVLIANSLKKEDWDYGVGKFNQIGGWGWVVGLVLGLILSTKLTIRDLFVIFSLVNMPSVFMAAKWIEEAPIRIRRGRFKVYVNMVVEKFKYLPNLLIHIPKLNKKLIGAFITLKYFYLANIMFYTGSLMFFSQFPVYLSQKGLNSRYVYLLSVFNSAVAAYMYTRAGAATQRVGATRTFVRALLLRVVSILIFVSALFLDGPIFVILAAISLALVGYTWAYISISAVSIISKAAKENNRGSMMGSYNLVASLGSIGGSLAGGVLVTQFGFLVDFIFAAIVVLASIPVLSGLKITSLSPAILKRYAVDSSRVIWLIKRQ